jgi:hypothetical protein
MNGWDLLTWVSSAALGLSAIAIFGFFLRDARGIIGGGERRSDDEEDE